MDIRKLVHVLGLAKNLTFSRASVDVNLSQPALSRSIQSIEAELGVMLFERTKRGVSLTPYGKVFTERARKIVLETNELRRDLALMQRGEYGELSIGLGSTAAIVLIEPLLDYFAEHAPQLRVNIKRGERDALLRLLLDEQVDIVFGDIALLEDRNDLLLSPLPRWPSGFFCAPNHPLANQSVVTRSELLNHRISSIALSPWAMADLSEYFEQSAASFISFRSDDFRDVEAAALGGRMVAFGNKPVFRGSIECGALREVILDPPLQRSARFGTVSLAARTLLPAAIEAKALVESVFEGFSRASMSDTVSSLVHPLR
ncbi:LysR family transcriptional regulator [Pseudomonas vancouverensis]|uniref:LysR family transcriptional regulator n=1 Tax=Pseudomonas vancouverensis TaxID=95300 RepID=A0A1H2NNY7_PSEVA|nr:LysR family transcriptional regulator [Pseudomonas vancouverensis]KAB0495370.1 LysR family transcriptional regulator [Pseudomonas vancouverensis]TDB62443.1 LysR family transcriptional regulator [Pseudomonas vancouverensis]SDV07064.1 transcriptional regulator, LysR family [Pseudomonas vancouverensis]